MIRYMYEPQERGSEKRCVYCGEWKPLSEFMTGRDDCMACIMIRKRENRYAKQHTDFVGGQKRRGEKVIKYTHDEWKATLMFFRGCCAYCGKPLVDVKDTTRDHIVSVKDGGKTEQRNIVPVCVSCNTSKKSSAWLDWLSKQDFYTNERVARIKEWLNE